MNNKQREPFKEAKIPDWRIIKRYNKDGTITKLKVDWNKIPCSTCEWRYHFGCPLSNCFSGNCWCSIVWFN